jgi:hypothetical protein
LQVAGLFALMQSGMFFLLQRLGKVLNPFCRACFISAFASSGLLLRLAAGPATTFRWLQFVYFSYRPLSRVLPAHH